jgi:hypothetical protein
VFVFVFVFVFVLVLVLVLVLVTRNYFVAETVSAREIHVRARVTILSARRCPRAKFMFVHQCRSLKSVGAEFPSEVGPTSNEVEFELKLHFRALRRLRRHAGGNDAHPPIKSEPSKLLSQMISIA